MMQLIYDILATSVVMSDSHDLHVRLLFLDSIGIKDVPSDAEWSVQMFEAQLADCSGCRAPFLSKTINHDELKGMDPTDPSIKVTLPNDHPKLKINVRARREEGDGKKFYLLMNEVATEFENNVTDVDVKLKRLGA